MQLIAELGDGHPEVGRARRVLARVLGAWGVCEPTTEVAVLLTSELVTNAIRHGSGSVRLRAGLARRALRVEVDAEKSIVVAAGGIGDEAVGRGLVLVDCLADRWGTGPADGSRQVWFELSSPT